MMYRISKLKWSHLIGSDVSYQIAHTLTRSFLIEKKNNKFVLKKTDSLYSGDFREIQQYSNIETAKIAAQTLWEWEIKQYLE